MCNGWGVSAIGKQQGMVIKGKVVESIAVVRKPSKEMIKKTNAIILFIFMFLSFIIVDTTGWSALILSWSYIRLPENAPASPPSFSIPSVYTSQSSRRKKHIQASNLKQLYMSALSLEHVIYIYELI